MPYSVEMVEDGQYVKVSFVGEMAMAEHELGRQEAVQLLRAHGFTRLLVDARDLIAKMSVSDDYKFTKEHQSTPLLLVRMAIVHRPEEQDRFNFIENVSVNRGGRMKTFTDVEEALGWLLTD